MFANVCDALQLDQADRGLAGGGIERADVAQHPVAAAGGLQPLGHRGVELRQALQEFVQADADERARHEAFELHVVQLQPQSHLAPEDDQLAREVGARQVVAGIRLGVAAAPSPARTTEENGSEPSQTLNRYDERAGQHALDAADLDRRYRAGRAASG